MASQPNPCGRLMRIRDVIHQTSLSQATIYRKIAAGLFPRPRQLGGSRVAWSEAEIEAWKADPTGWSGTG